MSQLATKCLRHRAEASSRGSYCLAQQCWVRHSKAGATDLPAQEAWWRLMLLSMLCSTEQPTFRYSTVLYNLIYQS